MPPWERGGLGFSQCLRQVGMGGVHPFLPFQGSTSSLGRGEGLTLPLGLRILREFPKSVCVPGQVGNTRNPICGEQLRGAEWVAGSTVIPGHRERETPKRDPQEGPALWVTVSQSWPHPPRCRGPERVSGWTLCQGDPFATEPCSLDLPV